METTINELSLILTALGIDNEVCDGGGHDYVEISKASTDGYETPNLRVTYTYIETPNITETRFAVHSSKSENADTKTPLACSPLSDVLNFCYGWWHAQ
jgi:hypothetical protein